MDRKHNPEDNIRVNELFDSDTDSIFTPEEKDIETKPPKKVDPEKKKKRIKIALISAAIIIVILVGIYIWGVFYYQTHFFPRTDINGIDVGGQTVQEALESIKSDIANRQVILEGSDGQTSTISGSEIDLTFDNEFGDLQKLLHDQNEYYWQINGLFKQEVELHTFYSYEDKKLDSIVNSLSMVSGPNVKAPENAKISYNGKEFVIDPAVDGDQPNKEKLTEAIVLALLDNDKRLNLKEKGLYNKPEVTADNQTLKDNLEKYNTAAKAVIKLNFPNRQVVLDKGTFHSWIVADGNNVTIDDNQLNTYVAQLAEQFNNNGRNVSFKAHNGNTYHFQYNSGWELNQAEEAAQLKQQILNGEDITEDPLWANKGSNFITGDTIGNTYIEVSLPEQTLYYYRNGSLVSYSTIVSGNANTRNNTETGLFFLQSKDTNVNLVVRQLNGTTENTQVRYWLPYSQNFGIESATWRTDFGGDIYINQGTDGDIDAPLDMAQTLYNNADVGTPVVIY